jgi:hypothetical protein
MHQLLGVGLTVCLGTYAMAQQPQQVLEPCSNLIARARQNDKTVIQTTTLQTCGPAGRSALAELIHGAGRETSRPYLTQLVSATMVSDPVLFQAASDLAADRAASRAARVSGLLILMHQTLGSQANLFLLDATRTHGIEADQYTDSRSVCGLLGGGVRVPNGSGLIQMRPQLLSLSDRIVATPGEDPVVRNLAGCIGNSVAPAPEARLNPADVQLRPVCSHFLSIQTTSRRRVVLDWSVSGTTATGAVSVDSGRATQFGVLASGTVVVSYKGQQLASARTSDHPCK